MAAKVATIAPEASFVDTLVAGLWQSAGGDPIRLAGGIVFLPTRRACRHVRDAFLRHAEGRAALLPRLVALGDADEGDLAFAESDLSTAIPPAIDPLRRRLLMTRLVQRKDPALPIDQAANLADALAKLVDEMHTMQVPFSALEGLVQDENLAEHWEKTCVFLKILSEAWPEILKEEGAIDPALRRNLVVAARIALWEKEPPPYDVTIAGADGSVPSVASLMRCVAQMPNGLVILPGLDRDLAEDAWRAVDESHPQYGMKTFLESLSLERSVVSPWGAAASKPRTRLLQEAMRPAETTDGWVALKERGWTARVCAGLERLELPYQQMEAEVIALRLRAALEEPGQTAALVTPDRALAGRVIAALARYGIVADDSAGRPLTSLPVGRFLMDLLAAAMSEPSPVDLLALLKHPLMAGGLARAECRVRARRIEKAVWRGVRLAQGWQGAAKACAKISAGDKADPLWAEMAQWLKKLADAFEVFAPDPKAKRTLADWVSAHSILAESMASTDQEAGAALLWRGEAGEAAARFLSDVGRAGADFDDIDLMSYARLCAQLMNGVIVRPLYGQHPRLLIQGPLEARLSQPNLIILGGLNDGVFPRASAPDPWLSRPMRRALGLPLPERLWGLSAHDFVQLASAPHVLMTRARREGGADVVPSRFWLQLDAVMRLAFGLDKDAADPLKPCLPWAQWAERRDAPGQVESMKRPRPCPPLAARPTTLSITDIGLWQRNPYAIYAKHILKLRPLDPLDADVSAREYGSCLHAALEAFLQETMSYLPVDALVLLEAKCREALAMFADRPAVAAFWMPRFAEISRWFLDQERRRREEGFQTLALEAAGTLMFATGALTLKGRADRVDRTPDGGIEIIDYKTGEPPAKIHVHLGVEPQLTLLALMIQQGSLGDLGARRVDRLAYWQLKGRGKDKVLSIDKNIEAAIEAAARGLEALALRYADPHRTYDAVPREKLKPKYDDYANLSRLEEWQKS